MALKALRRVIVSQSKDLKKVRRLASLVLRQRGEVEQFLIDSIQYAQAQKLLAGQQSRLGGNSDAQTIAGGARADNTRTSTTLPTIQSVTDKGNTGATADRKVRFNSQSKKEIALITMFGVKYVDKVHARKSPLEISWRQRCINRGSAQGRSDIQMAKSTSPMDQANIDQFDQSELAALATLEAQPSVQIKPKLDISQLTWDERERVLRYVFNKMNAVHQKLVLPDIKQDDEDDSMAYGSMSDSGRPNIV